MPATVKLIRGKYRIVEPSGKLMKNKAGTTVDGKGHLTRQAALRQARAINANS